jgi:hypothetical protein
VNRKVFGRKRLWSEIGIFLSLSLRVCGKPEKTSVGITDVPQRFEQRPCRIQIWSLAATPACQYIMDLLQEARTPRLLLLFVMSCYYFYWFCYYFIVIVIVIDIIILLIIAFITSACPSGSSQVHSLGMLRNRDVRMPPEVCNVGKCINGTDIRGNCGYT